MKYGFLTIIFAICNAFTALSQGEMAKVFGGDELILSDLFKYDSIAFEWNMSGAIQAELNDGLNFLNDQSIAAAAGALTTAIQLDRSLWVGYYYRGICHKLLGEFERAERDLKEAMRLKGQESIFFLELGRIHQLKGEFDLARRSYDRYNRKEENSIVGYYLLGNLSLQLHDLRGAKVNFEKCKGLSTTVANAQVRLGLIQTGLNRNFSAAIPYFENALKIDSTNTQALLCRGISTVETNPKSSLADFSKLIRLNPTNVNFRVLRGFLLTDQGEYEQAFLDLRNAIQENQQNANGYKGSQNFLDKRIDIQYAGYYTILHVYGMTETTASLVRKGFCFLVTGKYNRAIESFTEAQDKDTTAVTSFLSALSHEHAGQHAQAYNLYNQALLTDNDILDAHKKRGVYRSELKQWDGAISDFNEMIRINPEAITAYRFRGIAYYHKNDFEKAKDDFTRFIQRDSTDKEVFSLRGVCYKNLGDDLNAAYDFLAAGREDAIGFPGFQKAILLLLKAGDTVKAELELDKFIQKFPKYPAPHTLKIRVHELKNDWATISKQIDQVLALINPGAYEIVGYSYLLTIKGKSLAYQQRFKEALKMLTEAIRIDSKNGQAYFERSKIYTAMDKPHAARQDLIMAKSFGIIEAEKLLTDKKK